MNKCFGFEMQDQMRFDLLAMVLFKDVFTKGKLT